MGEVLHGSNVGSSKLSHHNVVPAKSVSPDERWSPDILKRIIEGHESTEIFEECNETKEYDERADNLVNELTKYINSGRLESKAAPKAGKALKNALRLETNRVATIYEGGGGGEDQARKEKKKHEEKYRQLEKTSQNKLSVKENEWAEEKERLLELHRDEIVELEVHMDQLRADLMKTKETLHDAITDNERFDNDLKTCRKELMSEKKKFGRLEKELNSHKGLKDKVSDLEGQLNDVSQTRYEDTSRIKELERVTKELREQNEDYAARLEATKASETGSENSSYLAEYFKTALNEFGDSYEGNNSNESSALDKRNVIIFEQEENISNLRGELDAVNRLLQENIAVGTERHNRELNFVTSKYEAEIKELQKMLEENRSQFDTLLSQEKAELMKNYEARIIDLRKELYYHENQSMIAKQEIGKLRDDCGKQDSLDALEESYRTQLTKLEKKITRLETEKAEMELEFLNQRAELEQQFRIERAELEQKTSITSREAERSKNYVDFLKDDLSKKHVEFIEEMQRINKKEKHDSQERQERKLEELNSKHQRELIELRKNANQQSSELEKSFAKERSSLKEGFTREKSEMEQRYIRERVELEDYLKQEYELEIANKMAEYQKDAVEKRAEIEETLRQEKYELSVSLQREKANSERELHHVKTEMEMKFTEEKNGLLKDFEYEKNMLENKYKRDVAELQQAFSGGEAGLKGKMKEDFTRLIEQRRKEWQDSFEKEKSDLLQSFAREKGEIEATWLDEKCRLEENFEEERKQLEHVFQKENQELSERLEKQKTLLEEEFMEEARKLKENRDSEFDARIQRETENLKKNADHLETELISLRQQKKEMETRNQILELKHLSQQQEAAELSEFQSEKKQMGQKITDLTNSIVLMKSEKGNMMNELEELSREKTTILDNSVAEITQLQERIAQIQSEKEQVEGKLNQMNTIDEENGNLKRDIAHLSLESSEKERVIHSLLEVEKSNESLNERNHFLVQKIKASEDREKHSKCELNEKMTKLSRLEEEVQHYLQKIGTLEGVHNREIDALKEKVAFQLDVATTERAKYMREIDDLKQQLQKANLTSDRDTALKEKVFNDAKAEVMSLNKKLEEKNRKLRSMSDTLRKLEERKSHRSHHEESSTSEVKNLKTIIISEKDSKTKEERNSMLAKSIRSDTLVTDLYLENADLMKQIANAENNHFNAEKQVRQLMDQKRALQRVISKLCHANGMSASGVSA